jgi:hypothetical protein
MTDWLNCTDCGKHLAKRLEDGRYEVKHKKRRAVVVISTEYCPRCGTPNPIPPLARVKEKKRPDEAQVISRPAEATP